MVGLASTPATRSPQGTAPSHVSPFHLATYVFIGGGFWRVAAAWQVLHEAARTGTLATPGLYRSVRHPQDDAFLLVMTCFITFRPSRRSRVPGPLLPAARSVTA